MPQWQRGTWLTIGPRVKNGSGMLSCICQDLVSVVGTGRRCLPCHFRFSSIWNTLCVQSGSRHKKDIDSLDRVQRQALAMIKGLRA